MQENIKSKNTVMKSSSKASNSDRFNQQGQRIYGADIIRQFKTKSQQVLIHDIKERKQQKIMNSQAQSKLIDFLKIFYNHKKTHWIQLAQHFVKQHIQLVNLKICLEYYFIGIRTNQFTFAFPAFNLLDQDMAPKFAQSFDKISKILGSKTNNLDNSFDSYDIKTASSQKDQNDWQIINQGLSINSPAKKMKNIGVKQSFQSKGSTKMSRNKDSLSSFQSFFQMLATGNLESANQNLDSSIKDYFKAQLSHFNLNCEVIKQTISYLAVKIGEEQNLQPKADLNLLQACLEKIKQKQKQPKNIEYTQINQSFFKKMNKQLQIIKTQVFQQKRKKLQVYSYVYSEGYTCQQKYFKNIQIDFKRTEQLFNKKSVEHSLQQRKNIQLQKLITKMKKQNQILNSKLTKLQVSLNQLKNTQDQFQKSNQNNQYSNGQTRQFCQNCQNLQNKVKYLQDKITNLSKYEMTLKHQYQKTQQKLKQSKQLVQKYITQRQKYTIQIQKQRILREKQINQRQQQKIEQQKQNKLRQIQKIQVEKLITQINLSRSMEHQSKQQLKYVQQRQKQMMNLLKFYTKLNNQFQTSDILKPALQSTFQKYIVNNLETLMASTIKERKNIIKQNIDILNQKHFLVEEIQKYVNLVDNKPASKIRSFRLIYRYDPKMETNIHQYIDNTPQFVVLIKLINGTILGGYSHEPLVKDQKTQQGFIFTFSLMQSYFLKEKYCLIYDDYYLIFGNSQIRIRNGQNALYSNFGISNAHFDNKNKKCQEFLNSSIEREIPFQYLEVFQVIFQGN